MEPNDVTLSDVHINARRPDITSKPDTDGDGYIVCSSRFAFTLPLHLSQLHKGEGDLNTDSDNDDQCVRRQQSQYHREVIYLAHTLESKLKDVGLQVWPGCLLLCDYLLSQGAPISATSTSPEPDNPYKGIILELGAGVGLASIVAAIQATKVIATDIGDSILKTCRENLEAHQYMYHNSTPYLVRELNFFDAQLKDDSCSKFGWSDMDKKLLKEVETIVVSDVIYDNHITDTFFETLERLVATTSATSIIITLEQRLNFTLEGMKVCCPAYDHFIEHLQRLSGQHKTQGNSPSSSSSTSPTTTTLSSLSSLQSSSSASASSLSASSSVYKIDQVETETIPQHFDGYSRSEYLELWRLTIAR